MKRTVTCACGNAFSDDLAAGARVESCEVCRAACKCVAGIDPEPPPGNPLRKCRALACKEKTRAVRRG